MKLMGVAILIVLLASSSFADTHNIAPQASITRSSVFSDDYMSAHVVDGKIGVAEQFEWACKGKTLWWGYVSFPWIQLNWKTPQNIQKIRLYDRACLNSHFAAAKISFSNGEFLYAYRIPNDGRAKEIKFPTKEGIEWVKVEAIDGDGGSLGLSEIEVFPAPTDAVSYVEQVDPMIETSRGRWFYFQPQSLPFGMISGGPHTRNKIQWGGGYNYNSEHILGFSPLRNWMLSGLVTMPVTTEDVDPIQGEEGWKSAFAHESEVSQPAYYRVFLERYKVWMDMTCTDRVALYRYQFTEGAMAKMLLSIGGYVGNCRMANGQAKRVNDHEIQGSFDTIDRTHVGPKKVKIYFVAQFDRPFDGMNTWKNRVYSRDSESVNNSREKTPSGHRNKLMYTSLPAWQTGISPVYNVKAGDTVQMKVALSFTSMKNARNNLSELQHWDFDRLKKESQAIWNDQLGKIAVKGGTEQQRVKLYTDLWHALTGRHKIDDLSGDYPDYTNGGRNLSSRMDASLKIRHLKRDKGQVIHHMYSSDAFWQTQWNLNVLWGLGWPEVMDEFSASLIQYAQNGTVIPRGPCGGGYSFIMTGSSATPLITAAYQKGLMTKTSPELAYEKLVFNHSVAGAQLDIGATNRAKTILKQGFDPGRPGVSVQWAYEDWCLSEMAAKLGKTKDEEYFATRLSNWKKQVHPKTGLIFPLKSNGKWMHTDPLAGQGWVESNGWQGTFSIPNGLTYIAEQMGGKDKLCEKLNYAFEQAKQHNFVAAYGKGYVSYANQPGCSNGHVFNEMGQPWRTQYWVRQVNELNFGDTSPAAGYGGHDEDQGQMSGVSALMSLGLFDIYGTASREPRYEITSPVFDEITIHLDPRYYPGKEFRIKTYNNSKRNCYIQKAKLDGNVLDAFWFPHEKFSKGGVLELWLGPKPNKLWGVGQSGSFGREQ